MKNSGAGGTRTHDTRLLKHVLRIGSRSCAFVLFLFLLQILSHLLPHRAAAVRIEPDQLLLSCVDDVDAQKSGHASCPSPSIPADQIEAFVVGEIKAIASDHELIAEIYEPDRYRTYIFDGGFDYLYDKVGLYDVLRNLMEGHGSCYEITRVWQQQSGDYAQHMLRFLENHDEQRIASPFVANDPWAAVPAMTVSATLHTGPFMLYFGQEVGVRADGAQGFSGSDGRTTIFDYWGLPDWQGFINAQGGKPRYDGGGLTDEQRQLRAFYQQLNHLVNESDAIQNGFFYDLQWANDKGQSHHYDADTLYSYLRYTERQRLLIVCNFSSDFSAETTVQIPRHAFETMGLDSGKTFRFTDIFLSGTQLEAVGREGIPIVLPPRGVRVFEIKS